VLKHRVGAQGITAVPGALLPQLLKGTVGDPDPVSVVGTRGPVDIDALLLRPQLSTATFTGDTRRITLLFSPATSGQVYTLASPATQARSYDARGRLVSDRRLAAGAQVHLPAGGVVLLVQR